MATAALDYELISTPLEAAIAPGPVPSERRADEDAVRVLLIEDRPQFGRVVCWALDRAARGHFDVAQAPLLEDLSGLLRDQVFDAILFDLGDRSGDGAHEAVDVVETLSHLLPVIVLTGTCVSGLSRLDRDGDPAALVAQEHLDCDRLPCTILDAIRRHRRVGQGGADPIVYRMHD